MVNFDLNEPKAAVTLCGSTAAANPYAVPPHCLYHVTHVTLNSGQNAQFTPSSRGDYHVV